jgi:hypothetical protein
MVSDRVFVFGSHYVHVPFWLVPVDAQKLTVFYELDFGLSRQCELARTVSITSQLIDAQPQGR